jgi:hypothetical protein
MLTVPVEEWIGNAAAVLSRVRGAVTRRSEQSGYSRTAIYQHAERVVEAVAKNRPMASATRTCGSKMSV